MVYQYINYIFEKFVLNDNEKSKCFVQSEMADRSNNQGR